MPRHCSVCTHPNRADIDRALVNGSAYRDVAGRFGLSKSAVARHQAEHLPAALVQGAAARDEVRALDVTQQLAAINAASVAILRQAQAARDGDLALKAIDRIAKQVELQSKLIGLLGDGVVVNIVASPEWLTLRGQIVTALVPFPQARLALAAVLDAAQ